MHIQTFAGKIKQDVCMHFQNVAHTMHALFNGCVRRGRSKMLAYQARPVSCRICKIRGGAKERGKREDVADVIKIHLSLVLIAN